MRPELGNFIFTRFALFTDMSTVGTGMRVWSTVDTRKYYFPALRQGGCWWLMRFPHKLYPLFPEVVKPTTLWHVWQPKLVFSGVNIL